MATIELYTRGNFSCNNTQAVENITCQLLTFILNYAKSRGLPIWDTNTITGGISVLMYTNISIEL